MIVGKKLTASKSRIVAGRFSGGSISPVGTLPADFDFTNGGNPLTALPAILTALNATYTRNSLKNVPQNGALVQLAANQFGTSYDDVTGLYGYLPEPAATNLATNSDGNAATYTTTSNVANGTAVPGFTNGLAFGNNSVQRFARKTISITAATAYTISYFVIMDDGAAPVVGTSTSTGDFYLMGDTGVASTGVLVRSIGGGVYRVSASVTAAGTASRFFGIYKETTQSARTFRITGIQVETGLRATSYINCPSGSTVARAADVLTVPLANITGYNSAGYTLFSDYRNDVATSGTLLRVSQDATNFTRTYTTSSGNVEGLSYVGGVVTGAASSTSGLARNKFAMSFAASDFKAAKNGATVASTSGALPPTPTTLIFDQGGTTGQLNGFIFRAQLIPTPLTQAQLNGLTT